MSFSQDFCFLRYFTLLQKMQIESFIVPPVDGLQQGLLEDLFSQDSSSFFSSALSLVKVKCATSPEGPSGRRLSPVSVA